MFIKNFNEVLSKNTNILIKKTKGVLAFNYFALKRSFSTNLEVIRTKVDKLSQEYQVLLYNLEIIRKIIKI
jgi:hypothetical protein